MEEPPLSIQAPARNKAAKLEADANLLNGLAAFWRGIGMSPTSSSFGTITGQANTCRQIQMGLKLKF